MPKLILAIFLILNIVSCGSSNPGDTSSKPDITTSKLSILGNWKLKQEIKAPQFTRTAPTGIRFETDRFYEKLFDSSSYSSTGTIYKATSSTSLTYTSSSYEVIMNITNLTADSMTLEVDDYQFGKESCKGVYIRE